jgi:hypothetical protein
MNTTSPVTTGSATPTPNSLAAPVAAYLGRFQGLSRQHTESDLRIFTTWCSTHDLDPLAAHRADLELYVRWILIDGVLEHSPADHLRRQTVPPESRPWA